MKYRPLWYILVLGCLYGMFSCTGTESVIKDGELRFSTDTLRFDTLFSTVGSTTAWLKIYNPNDKKIVVSSIYLREKEHSVFRFSVDAMQGDVFYDVEIKPKDSLYVFVELTAPWQNALEPVRLEDAIVFETQHDVRQIVLEAYSWDAIIWKAKRIQTDTLLQAERPYLIYDSLVIEEGATLRINPGVELYFHDMATVLSYGSLQARGTAQDPIVFRGDRLDMAFTDFPYDYYPGQWYGIYLAGNSYGNCLEHTIIRGAYYGIIADSSCLDRPKLHISRSEIFNMVYSCLYSIHSHLRVDNSLLANSGSYTLLLLGGDAEFVHCTIANYQSLVLREEAPALAMVNFTSSQDKKKYYYPLKKADFVNTIVYGSHVSELGFGLTEEVEAQLFFRNCLLRNQDVLPMELSRNVRYNQSPEFKSIGKDYRYDFHLNETSSAIALADSSYTRLYSMDLDGKERDLSVPAAIGAYAYEGSILP